MFISNQAVEGLVIPGLRGETRGNHSYSRALP